MTAPSFGFKLPNCGGIVCQPEWANPRTILDLAQRAQSLSYDSLWVHDHLLMPAEYEHLADAHIYDPMTVMTQVLASIPEITLGSAAVVLPLNEPVSLARRMMTLQSFHPGRVVFGVGGGQYASEFAAFGDTDMFSKRGKVVTEYLELLEQLFTQGTVDFTGEFRTLSKAIFHPTANQVGRPPLWIAGNALPAIRRAARFGDGWITLTRSASELREGIALLQEQRAQHGRCDRQFDVAMSTTVIREAPGRKARDGGIHEHRRTVYGDTDSVAAQLRAFNSLGVGTFILTFGVDELESLYEDLAWFSAEVMPALTGAGSHV